MNNRTRLNNLVLIYYILCQNIFQTFNCNVLEITEFFLRIPKI